MVDSFRIPGRDIRETEEEHERKIARAAMDWAADRIAKQRKIWKRLNVGNDPYSLRFHGGVEMAGSVLQRLVRKEAKKI